HRSLKIPARIADKRVDRCRVAEKVWLPLARVATNEAVEIIEAHSVRPLFEGPSLARLVGRRVVILAKPRSVIAVVLQDRANRAFLDRDYGIITRKARRYFTHHSETN